MLLGAVIDPIPVPKVVKQGVRAINSVVRTVKYDKYEDFPGDAKTIMKKVGENMGATLATRLGYIALQGGSAQEVADEYLNFLKGLSPNAIAQEMGKDEPDGSVTLIADALKDGVKGSINSQKGGSPWLTDDVVALLPELGIA